MVTTVALMFYSASLAHTWVKLTEVDDNLEEFKEHIGEYWWAGFLAVSPVLFGKKLFKTVAVKISSLIAGSKEKKEEEEEESK